MHRHVRFIIRYAKWRIVTGEVRIVHSSGMVSRTGGYHYDKA